jgi:rubrerythrin
LQGGTAQIDAAHPAGTIGITVQNLKASAEGEKFEWGTIYSNFGKIAKEEGFKEVTVTFGSIAKVETYHERRYLKLFENLTQGTVFKNGIPVKWKCINCG